MSDAARLKSTLYVGGLDQAVTAHTLAEAFVPFGEIADVTLPKPELPSSTDRHRGFGYVEFELVQDAREAMDNMDQSELYGRIIKVAAAKPQQDSNEGLGSKTAIWEQVCTPNEDLHILISNAGRILGKIRCCRRRQDAGRVDGKRTIRRSNARIGRSRCCRPEARIRCSKFIASMADEMLFQSHHIHTKPN